MDYSNEIVLIYADLTWAESLGLRLRMACLDQDKEVGVVAAAVVHRTTADVHLIPTTVATIVVNVATMRTIVLCTVVAPAAGENGI